MSEFIESHREALIQEVKNKLEEKTHHFMDILPSHLRTGFLTKAFIAGGSIYSLYNREDPSDYDFFLTDEKYIKDFREYFSVFAPILKGDDLRIGKYEGETLVVTERAISIGKFQIITKWAGTPQEVVGKFDFKHNQYYYYDGQLDTVAEWGYSKWEYLETRCLKFNENRARDIANCIMRVNRFVKRGFTIDNQELAKILLKLEGTGFSETDVEILKSKNNDKLNFGS